MPEGSQVLQASGEAVPFSDELARNSAVETGTESCLLAINSLVHGYQEWSVDRRNIRMPDHTPKLC